MTQGRRVSSGSAALFAVIVAVLVIALGVEGYLLLRPKPKASRPQAAQEAIASGPTEVETFGDPSAPIQIKLYAPLVLPWHQKTIGLLREYDKQHPGRIHVTLMPMGNEKCDKEMGYSCARLLINGKTDFTLPDGRKVMLEKNPNSDTSFYNSEDVITIIDQMVAKSAQK
jgi:hypothetical protein